MQIETLFTSMGGTLFDNAEKKLGTIKKLYFLFNTEQKTIAYFFSKNGEDKEAMGEPEKAPKQMNIYIEMAKKKIYKKLPDCHTIDLTLLELEKGEKDEKGRHNYTLKTLVMYKDKNGENKKSYV